jgi:hypothetical protein
VFIGRSIRYFGEGLLALWYGEQAIAFLHENARTVGVALAIAIAVGAAAWFWWKSRRRTSA